MSQYLLILVYVFLFSLKVNAGGCGGFFNEEFTVIEKTFPAKIQINNDNMKQQLRAFLLAAKHANMTDRLEMPVEIEVISISEGMGLSGPYIQFRAAEVTPAFMRIDEHELVSKLIPSLTKLRAYASKELADLEGGFDMTNLEFKIIFAMQGEVYVTYDLKGGAAGGFL